MAGGSGRGVEHHIPPTPPSRRHVWVTGPPSSRGPHAGLITAWERRDNGWHALVIFHVESDHTTVQQWLPAHLLQPVGRA